MISAAHTIQLFFFYHYIYFFGGSTHKGLLSPTDRGVVWEFRGDVVASPYSFGEVLVAGLAF